MPVRTISSFNPSRIDPNAQLNEVGEVNVPLLSDSANNLIKAIIDQNSRINSRTEMPRNTSPFSILDPESESLPNPEIRFLRAVLELLSTLDLSSIDKKRNNFNTEEKILAHAKKQGQYIKEEVCWGVVVAAIAMAVTGISVIPQLQDLHLDKFTQAGQQIAEKLLGSHYQPKMLIESSSRELLIAKLQQMNNDQAENNTRREVVDVLNRIFATREGASRQGG